jgi:hypothetical protein
MEVKLKTSLAQRDDTTGKLTVHHAGDVITVEDTYGQRMVRMDIAEALPVKQSTRKAKGAS